MELNPGYKETELGVIPEDWEVFQFSDHFLIYAGGDVPKDSLSQIQSEEYPYPIYANAIQNKGLYGFTNRKRANPDSVTITARGYLGHAEYRETPFFPIVRLLVLEPNGSLDARYTTYAINDRVNFSIESTGVPQLTAPQVGKYAVAAPTTLREQRAIATALSDVDALLDGLDRLIAKKRDLKQAAMQQLLTGKTRLPGFEGEWVAKKLGELLTICHGKSQREVEMIDGPFPILATGGKIGTANRPLYDKPSVLIGRKGTINQPQYMDRPFWTVDTLFYSIIKGNNNAKFLYYRFLLIDWTQYNEASGVPSLNARTIESIQIRSPEPKEQAAIATVLSDMDAEIATLEQRRNKTKDIKQAMMQELLTGKTRLVPPGGSSV